KKLASRRTGEFVGEIALVCDVPRVATVTATSPLRALVIRDREFRALLERAPAIALRVLEAVAARLPTAQFLPVRSRSRPIALGARLRSPGNIRERWPNRRTNWPDAGARAGSISSDV